jgi:hypothetical protein
MSDQNDFRNRPTYPYNTGPAPGQSTRQQPAQQQQQPTPQQTPPAAPAQPFQIPDPNAPPPTVTNPYFLAGYLQQFIGRFVRVEFSLGTSGALTDRVGILEEIGASYIVLRQFPAGDTFIGDLFSIKFVIVYEADTTPDMF